MSIKHKIAVGFIILCSLAAIVSAVDVMVKVGQMIDETRVQAVIDIS